MEGHGSRRAWPIQRKSLPWGGLERGGRDLAGEKWVPPAPWQAAKSEHPNNMFQANRQQSANKKGLDLAKACEREARVTPMPSPPTRVGPYSCPVLSG